MGMGAHQDSSFSSSTLEGDAKVTLMQVLVGAVVPPMSFRCNVISRTTLPLGSTSCLKYYSEVW